MVVVNLPDGKSLEFEAPLSVAEVASNIGKGLVRAAICGIVNDKLVDLSYEITGTVTLTIVTKTHELAEEITRHSCAHIMAAAVERLFPGTRFGIGPSIENGFYYDFDLEHKLNQEDLPRIENEMEKIVSENLPFERSEMTIAQAIEFFSGKGQDLKVELLKEMEGESVTIYTCGDFVDLCRGPHIPSTSMAPEFKLTTVAGAYWRGDVKNKMLQRIYANSFINKKELKAYLTMIEEAKKRDHRVLGKKMDLFSLHEEGPGFPLFHPNGANIVYEIEKYWREAHAKAGYQQVITPSIMSQELWQTSGHYDHYRENMYFCDIDEKLYAVKPMNCPGTLLVYKSRMRSYKELPMRIGEIGRVHRHEMSGVLHGLFRVRCFSIDDAHIFCTPEQLESEVIGVMNLIDEIYSTFGFSKYEVELSTRPEKSIGSDEVWEKATGVLKNALQKAGLEYHIEEGGGAFYGPKVDFKVFDSIGRKWQCGTVQVDFSMPERFELEYTGSDGRKHAPVLVHRAILGSLERFLGILIESTAGKFPLWLAPVQARIMTVTDATKDYAQQLIRQLVSKGIRVDSDLRNEKIGRKIREATLDNVPYMLVLGESEQESETAALRHRVHGDLGAMSIDEIVAGLRTEADLRSSESFWKQDK